MEFISQVIQFEHAGSSLSLLKLSLWDYFFWTLWYYVLRFGYVKCDYFSLFNDVYTAKWKL